MSRHQLCGYTVGMGTVTQSALQSLHPKNAFLFIDFLKSKLFKIQIKGVLTIKAELINPTTQCGCKPTYMDVPVTLNEYLFY